MLISHKNKFISIDIPKTGTRSLRTALLPTGCIDICNDNPTQDVKGLFSHHGTASECRRGFKEKGWDFNEYFKFSIIRNPWLRYFSFFKYYFMKMNEFIDCEDISKMSKKEIHQSQICLDLFKNVKEYKDIMNIIVEENFSQNSFISDESGEVIVNKLLKFEDLDKEFKFLCNYVGIDPIPDLPHENKTPKTFSLKEVFSQEAIDKVAVKEKSIIEKFGYSI